VSDTDCAIVQRRRYPGDIRKPRSAEGAASQSIILPPPGRASAARRARQSFAERNPSVPPGRSECLGLSPHLTQRFRSPNHAPRRRAMPQGHCRGRCYGPRSAKRSQDLKHAPIDIWSTIADKGKPLERGGRKATGLKPLQTAMAVRLPKRIEAKTMAPCA
jgi:hypothetical protein